MKNSDYVVQMREPEYNRDCLTRKLFDVNMRLFHADQKNNWYKNHILAIIEQMEWILKSEFEDYSSNPKGGKYGISGANLGIPYNIIAFWADGEAYNVKGLGKFIFPMINPCIITKSAEMHKTMSNCGSIKYKEKIPVLRHKNITVSWYDEKGEKQQDVFSIKKGGATIQHEVDHSNGILIFDRYLEQGGDPEILKEI